MECKFYVGQKIVCINDDWSNWKDSDAINETVPNRPVKGQKYTIREIKIITYLNIESSGIKMITPGILFQEITNPTWLWDSGEIGEYYFWHKRFAPLEEKKKDTDISIFRTILDNVNNKIKEKV